MPRTILLAVFAALLIAACRSAPSGSEGFRTIASGYHTGIQAAGLRVARTPAEWSALWRDHTSQVIPRPPAPVIDFTRELVVCVTAGEKPSGGYGIEVVEARFDGTAMVIATRETRPAEDAIVPLVLTRPYHMVAAPFTDAQFRLERR
ncbi:MAG: protease complex subunit PrcB family protein [Planctomycetes bacterium]|nr:protease complex subunit PrcB family protein [Planctomycetota bacterium]